MATRVCGRVKINCVLEVARGMPHGHQYKCTLSKDGRHLSTQYVGIPQHLTQAIDCPEAYDDAARAAVSFASNDGEISDGGLAWSGSGPLVTRGGNARRRRAA